MFSQSFLLPFGISSAPELNITAPASPSSKKELSSDSNLQDAKHHQTLLTRGH